MISAVSNGSVIKWFQLTSSGKSAEIEIEYVDDAGSTSSKTYKHAIHTTIGNKEAPFAGVEPTNLVTSFAIVVEQTMLNFVSDMQKAGKLK